MADIDDIKEYYANLLILQYRNKLKARETIKAGIDIYLGDGVVLQLQDILDIDTAEGEQLNLIGKILGCPRDIPGININTKFFTFHVDENSLGFSTVGNPSSGVAKNRTNSNLAVYSLQNDEYRQLLKFKAFVNVWRGDLASMNEALYAVFGDNVNLRNGNLSVTYEIQNMTIPIEAAIALGYFKAPMGIAVNIS
jgi:hypothetical protein